MTDLLNHQKGQAPMAYTEISYKGRLFRSVCSETPKLHNLISEKEVA
jgi:hypothetical protein